MFKPTFLTVLLLTCALDAHAQYVFKAINLGPKWTSVGSDNQGGLCYSDGAQIFHLDQSSGNPQALFAASEINGWSLTDDYRCAGSDVYVAVQRPSQQDKALPPDFALVRKRKGGTAQVLLQTGQPFTFTLAGRSVSGTPYYQYSQSGGVISYQSGLFPLRVYNSPAGRIFVQAHVSYASGPHAGKGGWVELELNSDGSVIGLADGANFPTPGTYEVWGGTAQFLWLTIQPAGSTLSQVWKFDKSGNGQTLGDPINIQAGACNSSSFAALFLTGGTGNDPLSANIRLWPDSGANIDLLTKATMIGGKPIGTVIDFTLLGDGNVFLIQSDNQNDNYLFRIGADGQDLVKGPKDMPAGGAAVHVSLSSPDLFRQPRTEDR